MTDEAGRLTVAESIELVARAKKIEHDAKLEHARLEAERDGWREIAHEMLKQALGDEAATFEIPPIELIQAVRSEVVRPRVRQWWADLTFKDSERRAKREFWREKAGVVSTSLRLRADQLRNVNARGIQRLRREWEQAVDALEHAVGDAESYPMRPGEPPQVVAVIAGEDLKAGTLVEVGPDGRVRRSK